MNTLLNPTYLHDTEKELVEAAAVLAIARNEPLPQMDLVTASVMTYLHGVCEAASEVRRLVLDALRRGEMTRALEILERMEQIYEELITFDFPDSLTHGLRRSVDALRAVLERTRSDVTLTTCQERLAEKLNTIQKAN
jgi:translin